MISKHGLQKLSKIEYNEDQYGRILLNSDNLYEMLLNGIDISNVNEVLWNDDVEKYNNAIATNYDNWKPFKPVKEYKVSVEEFDAEQQSLWFIPDEYKTLDVDEYVVSRAPADRMDRVVEELLLYDKYGLYDVLRACIYLVDMMRKNNIVWGVGRGSSVSSYVLYVIGIHKIDSVKYELNIEEFLK